MQSTETTPVLQSWQHTWRRGIAPQLSDVTLVALRDALACDDARLIQGTTTVPPPLQACLDWPVDAACLVAFCGWCGERLETVGEVEQWFAERCLMADHLLGEDAGIRWLTVWWDETPREKAFPLLLAEVEREIAERASPSKLKIEGDEDEDYWAA